jgi:biopolymer transport protein ExbB
MEIFDLIERGGIIVYILIVMNIIGITLMFVKFFSLVTFKKQLPKLAKTISQGLKTKEQLLIETKTHKEIANLEKGLGTIKIIASSAPLLGLLGTVFGIFLTFESISNNGLNDPLAFSSGISIALITTVVGLVVAIPHHIFYNYYIGALDNNEIDLKNEILKNI